MTATDTDTRPRPDTRLEQPIERGWLYECSPGKVPSGRARRLHDEYFRWCERYGRPFVMVKIRVTRATVCMDLVPVPGLTEGGLQLITETADELGVRGSHAILTNKYVIVEKIVLENADELCRRMIDTRADGNTGETG